MFVHINATTCTAANEIAVFEIIFAYDTIMQPSDVMFIHEELCSAGVHVCKYQTLYLFMSNNASVNCLCDVLCHDLSCPRSFSGRKS